MTGERLGRLWRAARRGWPPDSPVAQFPNPPLLLALAGWIVGALASGTTADAGRAVWYAGLAAWAWLELAEGANAFRRALGAAGFAYVVVRVTQALGG